MKNKVQVSTEYHKYYLSRTNTYSTFDKEAQKRWQRYCDFYDTYNEGVYREYKYNTYYDENYTLQEVL